MGTRFMVRKQNFAHVLKVDDGWPPAYARAAGSAGPLMVLTFRASDLFYDGLRGAGPRFFQAVWGTRWGTKVAGLVLDDQLDWNQVEALLLESYRLLAPTQLATSARKKRAPSSS